MQHAACHCREALCKATEKELQARGCEDHTTTAAALLQSYQIRQSFRVKDYFKGDHELQLPRAPRFRLDRPHLRRALSQGERPPAHAAGEAGRIGPVGRAPRDGHWADRLPSLVMMSSEYPNLARWTPSCIPTSPTYTTLILS